MIAVLDSCVAIKWLLTEENSDKATWFREQFRNGFVDFLAPEVFPIEAAHALTRAERKGVIPVGEAETLLADLLTTCPRLVPSMPLITEATRLSSQTKLGGYDLLYVALAEHENCHVLSSDSKRIRAFPNLVVDLATA